MAVRTVMYHITSVVGSSHILVLVFYSVIYLNILFCQMFTYFITFQGVISFCLLHYSHVNIHGNVNVFGLGRIDLLRCFGRACTETCYRQYIHRYAAVSILN